MKRWTLIPGALLLFAAAGQSNASVINPVVEYSSASTATDSRPFTLGYEFTTTTTFTVNALGYFDDGLGNNHQVGIWDSVGNLLVSTTVLGTDAITGHFRYGSIADFVLGPGDYVIGGQYLGNSDPLPIDAVGVTTLPGYTWVTDRQGFGAGLNFPTVATGGGYGDNGILLVDFSVAATTVPEIDPSAGVRAIALLLVALLVLRGRQKKDEAVRAINV